MLPAATSASTYTSATSIASPTTLSPSVTNSVASAIRAGSPANPNLASSGGSATTGTVSAGGDHSSGSGVVGPASSCAPDCDVQRAIAPPITTSAANATATPAR